MSKVVVIRNPKSGRGRMASRWSVLEEEIRSALGDKVEFLNTERSGHAEALAREAAVGGCRLVVAAGGDGTISQVANGLVRTEAILGVIPCGTGNDFCRTLGFGTSIPQALAALKQGRVQETDIGRWRTDAGEGYFLNVAGMGFDAAVADRINLGFKFLRGTSAYLVAVVSTLLSYQSKPLKITLDGKDLNESIMLAAIANAQSYGGGMKIAPLASLTDGLLDVVLVKHVSKPEFLRAFPKVFKGAHLGHPAVDHFRVKKIRLEPGEPTSFLIDGELTPCRWVEIEVLPKALNVIVP